MRDGHRIKEKTHSRQMEKTTSWAVCQNPSWSHPHSQEPVGQKRGHSPPSSPHPLSPSSPSSSEPMDRSLMAVLSSLKPLKERKRGGRGERKRDAQGHKHTYQLETVSWHWMLTPSLTILELIASQYNANLLLKHCLYPKLRYYGKHKYMLVFSPKHV